MLSRRDFLQTSMAVASIYGGLGFGNWAKLAAQDRFDQDALLEFESFGNVTLMHVSDIHAQMKPIYYRPPSDYAGFGDDIGKVPHLTGEAFRIRYGIGGATPMDYAFTHEDFVAHAQAYGKLGGLDRVATVVKAIRGARPGALLLDGGDTWVGSMTSLRTQGQDMVNVMNALKPDAMTFHSEFSLGIGRFEEIMTALPFATLGQNVSSIKSGKRSENIKPYTIMERDGVKIAVIGQVHPFADTANFGSMFPEYAFGVHEEQMQGTVNEVRANGATLVVCLSQNGFPIDQKMAGRVTGIDVILSGHPTTRCPNPSWLARPISSPLDLKGGLSAALIWTSAMAH